MAYAHFVAAREAIARRDLIAAIDGFQKALAVCPGDPLITRLLEKTRAAHAKIDPAGAAAAAAAAAHRAGHAQTTTGASGGLRTRTARKGTTPTPASHQDIPGADSARFLSALGATPSASPAVSLDLTGSGSFKELAVSVGILILLVAFGVLLLG